MKFTALPVTSLEDATLDFEQLQPVLSRLPCRGYRRAASGALPAGWTNIYLDTTDFDPGGHLGNPSAGVFNAAVAGYYLCLAQIEVAGATLCEQIGAFNVNSGTFVYLSDTIGTVENYSQSGATIAKLAAGDTVGLATYQGASGNGTPAAGGFINYLAVMQVA